MDSSNPTHTRIYASAKAADLLTSQCQSAVSADPIINQAQRASCFSLMASFTPLVH